MLAVAITRTLVIAGALAGRRAWPGSAVVDVAVWMLALSVPAMALAFLVGLLRWWVYVSASLRRLTARLRRRVRPEALRGALADAFEHRRWRSSTPSEPASGSTAKAEPCSRRAPALGAASPRCSTVSGSSQR